MTNALKFNVEGIRVRMESTIAEAFSGSMVAFEAEYAVVTPDVEVLRRELLASALRISESMAPDLYVAARQAAAALGVVAPVEIYQADGAENASIHLLPSPVVLELRGGMAALLDEGSSIALFGHELGHFLAHGGDTESGRRVAGLLRNLRRLSPGASLYEVLCRLSMARELTADRFALIACGDLDAFLRLEIASTTGLGAKTLAWDTKAYLQQCRDLIDRMLESGDVVRGVTHPEHSVRAYAAWLFSETREYGAIVGRPGGTRTLAEVETVLERIFGLGVASAPVDAYEPVPREVHECALAGAVLVAMADGVMAERELEAIERAFGTLVRDWRDFLDPDVARSRLADTSVVVRALGESAVRSVFSVLVHVMLADEEATRAEAAMILAVGSTLGASTLFEGLLASTLASVGVRFDDSWRGSEAAVLLPVSRDDAKSALDAFLSGARRRGTTVSTRRLLKLAGADAATDATMRLVTSRIEAAGLTVEPAPQADDLDLRLVLRPMEASSATPSRVSLDTDRAALIRAIGALRDELVGGDGRSPSVRIRKTASGRSFDLAQLENVAVGLAERVLAQVKARKTVSVVDGAMQTRSPEAVRAAGALLELLRENKSRLDETGADDLFVGYPLLAGAIDGFVVRGPLVLYPVVIRAEAGASKAYALEPREDPPYVNQSLLRLIFHKQKRPLSEELLIELDDLAAEGGDVDAILARLDEAGLRPARATTSLTRLADDLDALEAAKNVFRLDESAILGFFPQSSSVLLQEYEELLEKLANPPADVSALLGTASRLLPPPLRPIDPPLAADTSPLYPALFADPSQREVLRLARSAPALVVDGPPGTGKSQVIANLIVDSLARGERVAVVCEKRAALDVVVQRLDQLHLRPLLGVVHDVVDDRKELYRQLADRIEKREDASAIVAPGNITTDDLKRLESVLVRTKALLGAKHAGADVGAAQLHAIATSFESYPLVDTDLLDVLAPAAVIEVTRNLGSTTSVLRRAGMDSDRLRLFSSLGRVSFAEFDAAKLSLAVEAAERAASARETLERAVTAHEPPRATEHDEALVLAATEVSSSMSTAATQAFFVAASMLLRSSPASFGAVRDGIAALVADVPAARAIGRVLRLIVEPRLVSAVETLRAWQGRFFRFLSFGWWRARSLVRAEIATLAPELAGRPLDATVLDDVSMRVRAARAWASFDRLLDAFGRRDLDALDAAQLEARLSDMRAASDAASSLFPRLGDYERIGLWPSGDFTAWKARAQLERDVLSARRTLASEIANVRTFFPDASNETPSQALRDASSFVREHGALLVDLDAAVDKLAASLGRMRHDAWQLTTLTNGDAASHASARLFRTWAQRARQALEEKIPETRSLATRVRSDNDDVPRYATLERACGEEAAVHARLRADATEILRAESADKGRRRSDVQIVRDGMLKEAKKQRSVKPLRVFAREFASKGLLDVMPVWLLSPETMVTLFPPEPVFDLVIFDEASQCTVANGFPVLARTRRFVVAGDDKQMPPSAFFASRTSDDELDDVDEATASAKTMLAEESLLTLAAMRCERRSLAWHYRCRDEGLISFSNSAFYRGGLQTIPAVSAPSAPGAIRWVSVQNADYVDRRNETEARVVVNEVAALLARSETPPTVGVVTFNLTQRAAVLDAIDARLASDAAFAERWRAAANHADLDRRPFVKNLEQVQGDERDVIVFSLGHAPKSRKLRSGAEEKYVPARFGPLGQRGGERRLNVAISRARLETVIVSSFEPHQLNTAKSKNAGPALFKDYLEYAHALSRGDRQVASAILDGVSDGPRTTNKRISAGVFPGELPLDAQIAKALEERGVRFERNVGVSSFRVPLGVYHPTDATRFSLAILVDDGTSDLHPFERFVHRPEVLRQRGWKVLQVTAPEWTQHREDVLAAIEGAASG